MYEPLSRGPWARRAATQAWGRGGAGRVPAAGEAALVFTAASGPE
eukprot:CAMPEP_0116960858 /NCGR_PEP_ID=MMETSP0467-20121206/46203_1 /TAXON_ID=283647 /ORGANISM="Mesodinium pulex, Strain SPMC105" /LENGTH=44 /DNA_ID= /DNA_START= /DNA_END= /DNA_ORIENTATION=